jgi:hypothetical protein
MPTTVTVGDEVVLVRAYQIIVWVNLAAGDRPTSIHAFPAVLDTGHGHNFSIRESQLLRWAGLAAEDLPRCGAILVNGQETSLYAADVLIHRNRAGTNELLPGPVRLELPGGISVFREGTLHGPRLPLIGMRALLKNGLRLSISGRNRSVSLVRERI